MREVCLLGSFPAPGKLGLSCVALLSPFEIPGLCKGGYKAPLTGILCLGILFNTKKILLKKDWT